MIEPGRFLGREREVAELGALLREERVVTLTGVGGIGKTRLAWRVAFLERATVWPVELGGLGDRAPVAREVAEALGVRRTGPGGLLHRLRGDRALLVLDGCERVTEGCAALVAELAGACPQVSFLMTGRRPLGVPGEVIWPVPPLDLPGDAHFHDGLPGDVPPDAVRPGGQPGGRRPRGGRPRGGPSGDGRPGEGWSDAASVLVFVDRAAAAGARLDCGRAGEVERLCRLLDGMPLALELAAALAVRLTPERIAYRIGGRYGLLGAVARRGAAGSRPLLAVVELSHELLSPRERVLLRRLSVFAGPFDAGLAGRVCGDGGMVRRAEVPGLLGGLVAASLVTRLADGRHRLHGVVRDYADERLREAGEHRWARDRHLRAVCGERVLRLDRPPIFAGPAARPASRAPREPAVVRATPLGLRGSPYEPAGCLE